MEDLVVWFIVICRNATSKKQNSYDNLPSAKDHFFSLCEIKEFALNRRSEIFHQMIKLHKKLNVLRKNSLGWWEQ